MASGGGLAFRSRAYSARGCRPGSARTRAPRSLRSLRGYGSPRASAIRTPPEVQNASRFFLINYRQKKTRYRFRDPGLFNGSGGGIRTPDQPVNSRLLYH